MRRKNLRPIPLHRLTVQLGCPPRMPSSSDLLNSSTLSLAPEITRLWDPFENAFDDSGEGNPLIAALESDRPDLAELL